MSSLTDLEKKIILLCLTFFYEYGHFFFKYIYQGDSQVRKLQLEDLKMRIERINGKVKRSIKQEDIFL